MSKWAVVVAFTAVTALGASCGSSGDDDDSNGVITPGGGATGGTGAVGSIDGSTSDHCQPTPDETGCVGEVYAGETIPLDIFIMFDVSCSMSCPVSTTGQPGQCCPGEPDPRIDPVREAMDQFLNDSRSAGISVGIGYFGYMPTGETSCDPSDYADADVGIDLLPDHAGAILSSLASMDPTGETPTGAAIRGACQYANTHHDQVPSHAMAILLVTDGVPETPVTNNCNASVPDAVSAAEECLTQNGQIPTYVLGIGLALDNLNQIAAAGGTDRAYLVDGQRSSVLEALNAIRAAAMIPCELTIPDPPADQTLDYGQINIGICDPAGQAIVTYYVETPAGCDPASGGWYYDDPSSPESVVLCGATCDSVSLAGSQLYFSIGCETQTTLIE